MTFSLVWLPEVLLAAGLKVAEVEGWRQRGRREMGQVRGVMCHYTGGLGPKRGTMTSLRTLIDGRPDLSGPLAQLGLGRDGTYYVIAAGVANHAGAGKWQGRTLGNSEFIGIEAENSGQTGDTWPEVQMDAYVRGVAALLRKIGAETIMCVGHKEWAPTRKVDPNFDMQQFRAAVEAVRRGTARVRPLIPAQTGDGTDLPTLRRGMSGKEVDWLQSTLRVAPTGTLDAATEAAVRQFQRDVEPHPLVDDGIVGPKSWTALTKAFGPVSA